MEQRKKRKVVPLKTVAHLKAEKVLLDQDLAESLERAREMQIEIDTLRAQISKERAVHAGLLLDIKNIVHEAVPGLEMNFVQRFKVRFFPKNALNLTARYVQALVWCRVTNRLKDHIYDTHHGPATTVRKEPAVPTKGCYGCNCELAGKPGLYPHIKECPHGK